MRMPASLDGSERILLDQLFESAPEAIVLADRDSRVIRVNAEFTRLFGYTAAEARGKSLDELLAPLELFAEAEQATQTVADGGRVSFETVRRHKNGTRLNVSVLGTPIRVRDDQVAVFGIYRDVTPFKRTVDALRTTEAQFAVAFRATPGPAAITTVEGGRILEVTDRFVPVAVRTKRRSLYFFTQ